LGKTETISSKIRNRSWIPSHINRARERNERDRNKKEETELSLFVDDMIQYLKDPKDYTKRLLDLSNIFNKIGGYKTNTKKPIAFLYISNE
jgi:hypothetical protein